jgi:hypothetical protein
MMINDKVQKQEGGDSSTNLQGQSIIVNQGISYSDAKEIALDVYKSNYLQLSQDAAEIARSRAEELTDDFLLKLKEEKEEAIVEIGTPGMQSAIYEAQKQFAKTGDKDLESLLVDILVERAMTPERNIHQIVLDEALLVAGKLTTEQMDALTLNFLITHTQKHNLLNLESVKDYLNREVIPFTHELSDTSSCYQHLEYAACGSIMEASKIKPVEELFKKRYPALFSKGFSEEKFREDVGEITLFNNLLIRNFHSVNNIQLSCMNIDVLRHIAKEQNISEENLNKLITLFNSTLMNVTEIKEYLLEQVPSIKALFDLWSDSSISKFTLTTVGIAIAQANFRRRTGVKLDLGTWVK